MTSPPTREWQMPGWRLVPVEPTEDMLVAGQEAWMCTHANKPAIEDCEQSVAVWAAMLDAAPKAPPMPEEVREAIEVLDVYRSRARLPSCIAAGRLIAWLRAQGLVSAKE